MVTDPVQTLPHVVSDFASYAVLLSIGVLKAIRFAAERGWFGLATSSAAGVAVLKSVGAMEVDTFKSIVREEVHVVVKDELSQALDVLRHMQEQEVLILQSIDKNGATMVAILNTMSQLRNRAN